MARFRFAPSRPIASVLLTTALFSTLIACSDSDRAAINPAKAASPSSVPGNGQKIILWPDGAPGALGDAESDVPTLTMSTPLAGNANGCSVIICPGGGYGHLAGGYEGGDVGKWFNRFGITAFVLRYRHAPHYHHPTPLGDAQRAIRTVRTNAKLWKLDPDRIGIMGFSAGGHLTSTAGTHFDAGNPDATDPVERASSRPDFLVLAYPVITLSGPFSHAGSMRNLLGDSPDPALIEKLSSEKQVTKQTPPTFLFHTTDDQAVPAENAVLFYLALKKAGVPVEMHIYEAGPHGVGLGDDDPVLSNWPRQLRNWLNYRGLLKQN